MTAVVYRAYDANGELLYIGSTGRWKARQRAHAKQPWYGDVARWELEEHPTREAAYAAEAAAISAEHPAWNVQGMNCDNTCTAHPRCAERRAEYERMIKAVVDAAPPLTPWQIERLRALLPPITQPQAPDTGRAA